MRSRFRRHLVGEHVRPPFSDGGDPGPAGEGMWVLEGEEVDLHAGGDVGGLEGLELEGHFFWFAMEMGGGFNVLV